MSEAPDSANPRGGAGCLAAGALFAVIFVAIWLAAVTLYGLVVEQWEMIRVRREFSYDWVFFYAPSLAIGCAAASAFVAARRLPAARLTLLIVVTAIVALLGGVALFGLGAL